MTTIASAPGKVLLCGEYAVLDGAPAICMAVTRRARASVSSIAGDVSEVVAPGFSDITGQFRTQAGGVEWLNGGQEFALLDAVLNAGRPISEAVSVELQTQDFVAATSGEKLGIGSSAALTVALVAALYGAAGCDAIAQEAHLRLQGGVGSGADIACSHSGGLIEYRAANRQVEQLQWPEELQFRLLWSGVATSTARQIAKYQASSSATQNRELQAAAEAAAGAWQSRDAERVLAGMASYGEAMRRFDAAAKLGIYSTGHAALAAAAGETGLVYKPCGAGGGDTGIVLGLDAARLDKFVLQNAAATIECDLDSTGVRTTGP